MLLCARPTDSDMFVCQILNKYQPLTAKEQIYLVNVSKTSYIRKGNKYLPKINAVGPLTSACRHVIHGHRHALVSCCPSTCVATPGQSVWSGYRLQYFPP